MKKLFALLIVISILVSLAACGENGSSTPSGSGDSTPGSEQQVALLYADFAQGNSEGDVKTYEMPYTGELTPDMLMDGLAELTGLDFSADITTGDDGIWVAWDGSCSLFTAAIQTQTKEFTFYDNYSLSWFMMDSLWRTLSESFGCDIYYTSDLGGYLVFGDLQPLDTFPNDTPYMGSAFYFAHSGDEQWIIDIETPDNMLVFTNGADFTQMVPLETENFADGTYFYMDITEDGLTVIVNTAISNSMTAEEGIEAYLERMITELEDVNESSFALESLPDQMAKFTYPCYRLSWLSGGNEDTRYCVGHAVLSDLYTYFYYFLVSADHYSEMEDVYVEILENLQLTDMPGVGEETLSQREAWTLLAAELDSQIQGGLSLMENMEDTIDGEHCWTFILGENTTERFVSREHFAVTDSGAIYGLVLETDEYVPYAVE